MREIALDTETTGLDPRENHRIVEIGCVEMINRVPTGKTFHCYLNPERDMPKEAFQVHGLSAEFLSDKPKFPQMAELFMEFIGPAPLVIHNASFDMKFINFELEKSGIHTIPKKRAVDTLLIARKKYPGAPASLDALCRRFKIDLSARDKHGALLDAQLLALVYLELMGGSQESLELGASAGGKDASGLPLAINAAAIKQEPRAVRTHVPTAEEQEAHERFLQKALKNGCFWT